MDLGRSDGDPRHTPVACGWDWLCGLADGTGSHRDYRSEVGSRELVPCIIGTAVHNAEPRAPRAALLLRCAIAVQHRFWHGRLLTLSRSWALWVCMQRPSAQTPGTSAVVRGSVVRYASAVGRVCVPVSISELRVGAASRKCAGRCYVAVCAPISAFFRPGLPCAHMVCCSCAHGVEPSRCPLDTR